jgi:vacuolar fusion protein MON1
VPEPEVEVETADSAQATATGTLDDPAADEEAKRHLREQLRRTLSHKTTEAQPAGEAFSL